ncbi:MAG: DUF2812 domain-containing protein [Gudongella sp.]|nr:DUF2812 domain-containing protein [Gudongella sp.]
MSNRKIHRLEGFRLVDWKVMEDHYRNMASRGMFIERFKWGISTYREGYQEDLEYSIAIYPQPKAFETVDDRKAREYIDKQEEKGWEYVASKDNMHIFSKKSGDVLMPIDRSDQISNVRKSIKLDIISMTLFILMNIFNMWRMFPIHPSMFYSNTGLISLAILPLISLFIFISVIENIRIWLSIREDDNPEEYPYRNPSAVILARRIQNSGAFMVLALIFMAIAVDSVVAGNMILLTILPVLVGLFVAFKLRGLFVGRDMGTVQKTLVAFIVVFVVIGLMTVINMRFISTGFGDRLPEGYKALRLENPDEYSFRREGSIIAPKRYSYTEWSRGGRVSTEVTGYINDSVAEYFFDLELESYTRYVGEYWDASEWYPEFDKAYFATFRDQNMDDGGTIFLKRDDYIVGLSMERDLREEEMVVEIYDFVEELF